MRHQSAASLVVISAVMVLAGGSFGPAPAALAHGAVDDALFPSPRRDTAPAGRDWHRHVRGGLHAEPIVLRDAAESSWCRPAGRACRTGS